MSKKEKQNLNNKKDVRPKGPSVFSVLKSYKKMIIFLIFFALVTNALNLFIPKIIASSIDAYTAGTLVINSMILKFSIATALIFIFLYAQSIVQTYASEKVARDLREKLANKISRQSYTHIQNLQSSKILTTLTSDIDSIKMFVSVAIVTLVSSITIILGASALLISINWRLALVVLDVIPLIGVVFYFIFSKIKFLFIKTREAVDWLNKVINESILGASIIRVVNAQQTEYKKFLDANTEARNIGLSILALFSALIPIITFISGLATLAIVLLGGHFVIQGSMSLGDFTAFYTYLAMLVFPIIIIGFMSNLIAQASASYTRVCEILDAKEDIYSGKFIADIKGDIDFKNVSILYDEKYALKDISFSLKAGTKTAIVGPTAAGKSQLLYLLIGLIKPSEGKIFYDNKDINDYDLESFHNQVAFVFQDSSLFNLSIRENIAFNNIVTDESLSLAIKTAEIDEFINNLPDGLETIVSERGTSLSGGQKQRIMLARALANNPKVLLLDDFTARVDNKTEKSILNNIAKNYPNLTLVSVTQKISTIEHYDNIIVMMEGELLAQGKHEQLIHESPEYVQIYNSQRSTNNYEIHT